jgi:hypothetical protein
MRMWMVEPKKMCRKHLLGEHVEIHMMVGTLLKCRSIDGFLDRGLLEPQNAVARHDELVAEMVSRGFTHRSPLPDFPPHPRLGEVSRKRSELELAARCPDCRRLMENSETR